MKQKIFTVSSNRPIAKGLYEMKMAGSTEGMGAAGQFVNIKLEGRFLRRPISVSSYDGSGLTIIYKVVGGGTEDMSAMQPGTELDLLTGLGNGFDTSKSGIKPLLIGGGVGAAPLYGLCEKLISEGKSVTVCLGFGSSDEAYYIDEFEALGAAVHIATEDGSLGLRGFVTETYKNLDYSYFYTCGPTPMLRAVQATAKGDGQFSFEERMGCGFGACMGCSCKTITGYKRICRDGPVLERKEILWPTQE